MAKKYDYDSLILSGRPIAFIEGLDFVEPIDEFKQRFFSAARRRGLKLVSRRLYEPDGVVFQAYIPGKPRPVLPLPSDASAVRKNTHPHLFCIEERCNSRIKPLADNRRCCDHRF